MEKCPNYLTSTLGSCFNKGIWCAFDGSCWNSVEDCPTLSICPLTAPIKCEDGQCVSSLDECQKFDDCPFGSKACPDGTCTYNQCLSQMTCNTLFPIKCYDGTCK